MPWYNPRRGGELQNGSAQEIKAPGKASIVLPPADQDKDWVALVKTR